MQTKEVKAFKKTLLTWLRAELKKQGPKVTDKEWESTKASMADFDTFLNLADIKATQESLRHVIDHIKAA